MKKTCLKGYKVTNSVRTKTVGIACSSFSELLSKSCNKFLVPSAEATLYLSDGTLVDSEDYFLTIPAQTVFTLVKLGETFLKGADLIYNTLKLTNIQFLRAGLLAGQFLQDDIKDKIRVLSKVIDTHVDEEPLDKWLQGVETSCKTKESFMETRCRDRMKSYFYKACSDIRSSSRYLSHSKELNWLMKELKDFLVKRSYQGCYFNRNRQPEALCDSSGVFKCSGVWSKPKCHHCGGDGHTINPYLTRETRIVFSTWNLDHRVERSRTIVPTILEAVTLLKDKMILNVNRVYDLLFTTSNLKLVHIVCHDKGAHLTATCDPLELTTVREPSWSKLSPIDAQIKFRTPLAS